MISKPVLSLLAAATALALSTGTLAQNASRVVTAPGAGVPQATSPFAPNATITEGFDTVAGTPPCPAGWTCNNASTPIGATSWFQGGGGTTFPAQAGAPTSYIGANFENAIGNVTISNWLISPVVQFGTGSQLRFWSRAPSPISTYADRLEIRASTGGTNTGGTNVSTGDFSTLLGTINPALSTATGTCVVPAAAPNAGGYPDAWCEYLITNAQGIPTTGSGRIAFRYFVTNGGTTGANSDFIGIDTFSFVEGGAGGATIVPTTAAGAVTIPPRTLPTASANATLSFTASAASSTTCVATGAGYSVSPSPLTLPAATAASVTVTQNSAVAGTYTGTVTCTNAAGATPASFVYNFTHVVNGAPVVVVPVIPVPALNIWGSFALLAGLGLFGAFAVRRFS